MTKAKKARRQESSGSEEEEDTTSESSDSSSSSSSDESVKKSKKTQKKESKRSRKKSKSTSSSSASDSEASSGKEKSAKRKPKKSEPAKDLKVEQQTKRHNEHDKGSKQESDNHSPAHGSKWDSPKGEHHSGHRRDDYRDRYHRADHQSHHRQDDRRYHNSWDNRKQDRFWDNRTRNQRDRNQHQDYDRDRQRNDDDDRGENKNWNRDRDSGRQYQDRRREYPDRDRRDYNRDRERDDRRRDDRDNRDDRNGDRRDNRDRRRSRSPRRPRNFPRRRDGDDQSYEWGRRVKEEKDDQSAGEKEKPNFGLSGKLTEDTNKVNGIIIKYAEPLEARKPKRRWRLYPFKGEKALPTLYVHRQSCYLIGRDRKICDLPVDHPSCSKQHAAFQYRLVPFDREDGSVGKRVRPYIIDLESANGTFLNNKPIEPKKYIELIEKDVIKFGFSSREYVLLHENSKEDQMDDDVGPEEEQEVAIKEEPAG